MFRILLILLFTGLLSTDRLSAQSFEPIDLVEFRELPLQDALRALSQQTGIKVAASLEAREIPVSLYLENVTAYETLQTIASTHGLYLSGSPGADILRLHTAEEYNQDVAALRREQTAIFTLRYPNARDVALAIRDLYGPRVVLAQRIDDSSEPEEFMTEELSRRLERFDVLDARSQGIGIFGSGSGAGSAVRSLDNNFFQRDRNDSFRNRRLDDREPVEFQTLTPEQIAALEGGTEAELAASIDRLLTQQADIFVAVVDRLNKVMVRTRDERTMNEIRSLVTSLDTPTPLVLLEVRILAVDLERGLDTAFDWDFTIGTFGASFQPGGPVDTGNLVFQTLNDRFNATIQLLQTKDRITALGKPLLLTANNEVSRIFIGEEVPLNRSFNAGQDLITDGTVIPSAASTDIEFRPVGSTLLITPNINDDRTVMLRLLQEESRVVQNGADVLVPDGRGGFVNRDIDIVASQTASGTFAAKHGQTVAIGGLIREDILERRSQIPLLGDIPILGLAFRAQETGRNRQEVILLMTPYIISTPVEAEAVSRRLVESNSMHPLAPSGEGSLELYGEEDVLQPSTDELDYDANWKPKIEEWKEEHLPVRRAVPVSRPRGPLKR